MGRPDLARQVKAFRRRRGMTVSAAEDGMDDAPDADSPAEPAEPVVPVPQVDDDVA